MEIVKCHFVFFMTALSILGSETVAYGAGRVRRDFKSLKDDMPFIRKDITELFDKRNQPNIPADEGCGPCVSVNKTICPPVMDHDGSQNMTNVNSNNSFIKAFVTGKIRQELQDQLQSVKDILSANNKSAHDQLRSMKESIEDLHNNIFSFMRTISDRIDEHLLQSKTTVKPKITTFPIVTTNCTTVPESGVYTLYLESIMSIFTVYCDQHTDGGGWIVFIRRQDGSVNFTRPWVDYKHGFGSPDGEFWAGNEMLHRLTKAKPLQLRIDLEDFEGNTAFATYDEFKVGAEEDKYRLHVSGYSGTAGDSLIDTTFEECKHAGMQFSTFDSVNNKPDRENCVKIWKSGWWYNACGEAYLTTQYSHDESTVGPKGIMWYSWKGFSVALKRAEMKIR